MCSVCIVCVSVCVWCVYVVCACVCVVWCVCVYSVCVRVCVVCVCVYVCVSDRGSLFRVVKHNDSRLHMKRQQYQANVLAVFRYLKVKVKVK